MNYEIAIKPVAKGAKRKVTVSLNGQVIGQRTSARPYRFALVVRRNQAYALESCRKNLAHQLAEQARYQAVADDAPGARAAALAKDRTAWQRQQTQKFIADGDFARWAKNSGEQAEACRRKIAVLESGPQPEFEQPFVVSWHSRRGTVPNPPEWYILVNVLEIPEAQ
jgi:hypothetical protein